MPRPKPKGDGDYQLRSGHRPRPTPLVTSRRLNKLYARSPFDNSVYTVVQASSARASVIDYDQMEINMDLTFIRTEARYRFDSFNRRSSPPGKLAFVTG